MQKIILLLLILAFGISQRATATKINSTRNIYYPASCAAAAGTTRKSGIYVIQLPATGGTPFEIACNEDFACGGWTIVQRRLDGSIDFYRDWQQYKYGFGIVTGEYFIGLENLHQLTQSQGCQELAILMEDFNGVRRYAIYDNFAIGSERDKYALQQLGTFSGDAGDSLSAHLGQAFSTFDRDNDAISSVNCAAKFKGAWWYTQCHESNLNGKYLHGSNTEANYGQGVVWQTFRGSYCSLKFVQMMIRPSKKYRK